MKNNSVSTFNMRVFVFAALLMILLCSCAGTPKRFIASDASLVHPGQNRGEITQLLGRPDGIKTNQQGLQEWYYYEIHRPFWHRIPLFGHYLGKEEVEGLQIILDGDEVVKAVYYVQRR